ncbi:agmatine deiminase family protein [Desulfosoma sp.]
MKTSIRLVTMAVMAMAVVFEAVAQIGAESEDQAVWRRMEAACYGNLACMRSRVREVSPPPWRRGWTDPDELFRVLQRTGRFRELGLKDEEGLVLVREVLARIPSKTARGPGAGGSEGQPLLQGMAFQEPDFPYRAPAEFEPVKAVLLRWPFDWKAMQWAWAQMVETFGKNGVRTAVWVNTPHQRDEAAQVLQDMNISTAHVRWVVEPTDTVWIRDYGPQVIRALDGPAWGVVDFHYYDGRRKDDNTPLVVAWGMQVPLVDRQKTNVVYTEGGNLNHDGLGCVVYSQRTYKKNPGIDPQEIDRRIRSAFQAVKSLVPRDPRLDGTGHVDMFMKIVGPNTVLVGRYGPDQVDADVLEACAALFAHETNGAGQPWRVVRIVQPDVYYTQFVIPVVRTYTNSLIVNNAVIVPVYGIAEDEEAVAVYRELFPDKTIVPLNAQEIIPSGGAWHCVTMEMATAEP